MNFYRNRFTRWFIWRFIIRYPKVRRWLTRLLVKEEEKEIELFGSKLAINTISEIGYANAAKNVGASVVIRDEVGSLLNLALILEPGDTFVDIGANVGLFSSVLGRMKYVFPGNAYHAFEANPTTFVRLRRTVSDKAVEVRQVALSERTGTLRFASGPTSGEFHSRTGDGAGEGFVEIPCARLDSFPLEGDSLVLKIDVEGHEWPVLQGAAGFFAANRIKAVYLDGYDDPRITPWLQAQGFRAFDGRSLRPSLNQDFSVLWLRERWIARAGGRSAP